MNLVGQKFGRLEPIGDPFAARVNGSTRRLWVVCQCECGELAIVNKHNLVAGNTKSCGCLGRESVKAFRRTKYAAHDRPLTKIWRAMWQRCSDPRSASYARYGGRGVSVCRQWASFEVFRDWARSAGWQPGTQIDRIDSDGHYEPTNCRILTPQENSRNRSSNVRLAAFGEPDRSLVEWCEDPRCCVEYSTLRYRVRHGWPLEEALTTPSRNRV